MPVFQFSQLAKDIAVIDLPRSRFMPSGDVGNMDKTHVLEILLQFFDEIAFRDLLVKKVVEKLHLLMADGFNDLKAKGDGSQKVVWILFRVNVFEQKPNRLAGNSFALYQRRRRPQSRHAAFLLSFNRHAGNLISGKQDNGRASNPVHDWKRLPKLPKQGFPLGWIREPMFESRRAVERDAKLLAFGVGAFEIRVPPVFVLAH